MQLLQSCRAGRYARVFPALSVFLLLAVAVSTCNGQSPEGMGTRDAALASQPGWMEPLITPTGLLTQEVRADGVWKPISNPDQKSTTIGGDGVSVILPHNLQVSIGPSYVLHNNSGNTGWSSTSLTLKKRLLSANEEHGDYVLTAFLNVTTPTGTRGNGVATTMLTPALAFGKGWGNLDLQASFSAGLPTDYTNQIGNAITNNVAVQYHLWRYFWPEVEWNSTWIPNRTIVHGLQEYLTPGLMMGAFHIGGPLRMAAGTGYQIGLNRDLPQNNGVVITTRLSF